MDRYFEFVICLLRFFIGEIQLYLPILSFLSSDVVQGGEYEAKNEGNEVTENSFYPDKLFQPCIGLKLNL